MMRGLWLVLGLLGQPGTGGGAAAAVPVGWRALPRVPVRSSNLASVGYDARSQTLEVAFRRGSVYQYYGVPARVYEGLMRAESHGRYLDQYVKKGGYRYREMTRFGQPALL